LQVIADEDVAGDEELLYAEVEFSPLDVLFVNVIFDAVMFVVELELAVLGAEEFPKNVVVEVMVGVQEDVAL
jgi:hypothetical protein